MHFNILLYVLLYNFYFFQKKLTHKTSVHDEKIKNIADFEMECRKELHLLQVENEKKKGLNIDLENELLKIKIMVYKKQLGIYFFKLLKLH